jgi:hypothetical protein
MKDFLKLLISWEDYQGAKFLSRSLIFRVGGKNIIKYTISELLDKAFKLSFKISK